MLFIGVDDDFDFVLIIKLSNEVGENYGGGVYIIIKIVWVLKRGNLFLIFIGFLFLLLVLLLLVLFIVK